MGLKLSEWKLKITENVSGTLSKISGATDKATGKFSGLQDKIGKFSSGVRDAANEVPGLNQALSLTTNPYVALAAGIAAVGGVLVKATGMAMDFEKGMAKVNVTAGLTPQKLKVLKDNLLDVGSRSTVDILQIPDAFNQVISAVGDVDKSLQIFEPTLKAAKAGFTDVKVVADAVTNVMGGVKNATPTEVLDTLFATMNKGKAEFNDISNYLPKILPFSNQLGASFKETAGAFALLTAKGQSIEGTTTMLQNVYRAFANKDRIKDFEAMGIALYDNTTGKFLELPAIVDNVSEKLKKFGNNTKARNNFLASLGLDAEASAGLNVLVQNAEELRDFVRETTNSAGAMEKAYGNSLNTADKLQLTQQRFNKILVDIGYKILPYVNRGLEKVNEWLNWGIAHGEEIKGVLKAVGWVLEVLIVDQIKTLFDFIQWIIQDLYETKAAFAGIGAVISALGDPIYYLSEMVANIFNPARLASNIALFRASLENLDVSKAYNKAYERSMDKSLGIETKPLPMVLAPDKMNPFAQQAYGLLTDNKAVENKDKWLPKPPPVKPTDDNTKILGGINAVTSGGKTTRNITVKIDNLVNEISIKSQTVKEGAEDIRRIVLEELVRAVNGAEIAVSG